MGRDRGLITKDLSHGGDFRSCSQNGEALQRSILNGKNILSDLRWGFFLYVYIHTCIQLRVNSGEIPHQVSVGPSRAWRGILSPR